MDETIAKVIEAHPSTTAAELADLLTALDLVKANQGRGSVQIVLDLGAVDRINTFLPRRSSRGLVPSARSRPVVIPIG